MNEVVVPSDTDNVATCLAHLDAGTRVEVTPGGKGPTSKRVATS